jgi:paraquat-inducible protein A
MTSPAKPALRDLLICEHCDALYHKPDLHPGQRAICVRCSARLLQRPKLTADGLLALSLAALIVLVIANIYPIIGLQVQGHYSANTLWGAIIACWNDSVAPVAVVVALTIFFIPLAQLLLRVYLLLPFVLNGQLPPGVVMTLKLLHWLKSWAMVAVFVLGVFVSIVKIADVARVIPGIGIVAFATLTVLLTAINSVNLYHYWDGVDAALGGRGAAEQARAR